MKPKPYKINGDFDAEGCVIKITYGRKYVIMKCKNQVASLHTLENLIAAYIRGNDPNPDGMYYHLLLYVKKNPGNIFKVTPIISNASDAKRKKLWEDFQMKLPTYSGYDLLKAEQIALDSGRKDKNFLNNNTDAYVPMYNPDTQMYGWITRADVLNFTNWYAKRPMPTGVRRRKLATKSS